MESKSELIKPVDLECIDLQKYLKSKPSAVIETLYNHPSICLAVYRELPEIARQFVIRILFVEQPVPQAVIASWTSQSYSKEHSLATSTLSELMIWRSVAIPGIVFIKIAPSDAKLSSRYSSNFFSLLNTFFIQVVYQHGN